MHKERKRRKKELAGSNLCSCTCYTLGKGEKGNWMVRTSAFIHAVRIRHYDFPHIHKRSAHIHVALPHTVRCRTLLLSPQRISHYPIRQIDTIIALRSWCWKSILLWSCWIISKVCTSCHEGCPPKADCINTQKAHVTMTLLLWRYMNFTMDKT